MNWPAGSIALKRIKAHDLWVYPHIFLQEVTLSIKSHNYYVNR